MNSQETGSLSSKRFQRGVFLSTIRVQLLITERELFHNDAGILEQVGITKVVPYKLWKNLIIRTIINISLPFVLVFADVFYLVTDIAKNSKRKNNNQYGDRVFIDTTPSLYNLSKRSGVITEGDLWFSLPRSTVNCPIGLKSLTVYDLIGNSFFIKAFKQAIVTHVVAIFSLGYKSLFLTQKAYEWYLVDFALRQLPISTEVVFAAQRDRIAILVDNLPHNNKTLVQHGVMYVNHLFPVWEGWEWNQDINCYTCNYNYILKSVSQVYCYTEKDKEVFKRSLTPNVKEYHIIGYDFSPSFKPEGKSVLIIGNYTMFGETEVEIVKELQNLDITIYIKGHPTVSDSCYNEALSKCVFTYLPGNSGNYPDADLVISYESTLAYQYEALGREVLYYGNFDIKSIRNIVCSTLMKRE